jgi:hypothetical protein
MGPQAAAHGAKKRETCTSRPDNAVVCNSPPKQPRQESARAQCGHGGAVGGWERRCALATFAVSIRPVQLVASAGGVPRARPTTFCAVAAGSGFWPGLRPLSRARPFDVFGHEPPAPYHRLRFTGSAHDVGGAAVLGRRDGGAPHLFLRRAAVGDETSPPHTRSCRRSEHQTESVQRAVGGLQRD